MGTTPLCPICKKPTKPRESNRAAPFCSVRCKTVDLGKWLNGDYRITVEDSDDEPREDI